jgi:transitional endoplasmic reticulum ATPase
MYVGESERKLRELFAEARRNAPAVLVFDEFDSIAGRRTGRDDGGSRAGNAIVAQLLTELDGFRPEVPVLIIGTTNRIDIIDDALLRPSRFRPIKIDLPDPVARKAIARCAEHFEIEHNDALLTAIAEATEGMNGDEIRSIFRDARADELVGDHRRPDARRLGELIGAADGTPAA